MSDGIGREFRRVFAGRELQAIGGRQTFERGMHHAAEGRVSKVSTTPEGATAEVRGSVRYEVELRIDETKPGTSAAAR